MPPRSPKKPAPVIVKRSAEDRKKLPPELEAFARSQDEKLRLPRKREDKGRLRDPREGYTIAGVSNRDARAVYDARAAAMRTLWADGAGDQAALTELGGLLHDALRLALWRARRVTGFDAFVEQVLGLPAARARELAAAYGAESGESDAELSERSVAIWLRSEAGMFEGDATARARIRGAGNEARLELSLWLSGASLGLAGVGARHAPLAREQSEAALSRSEGGPKARSEGGAKLLTRRDAAPAATAAAEQELETSVEDDSEAASGPEQRAAAPAQAAPADKGGARLLRRRAPAGAEEDAAPFARRSERGFGERRGFERGSAPRAGFDAPRFAKKSFGEAGFDSERPGFADKRGFGQKRAFGEKRGFAGDQGGKRAFDGERPFREQRPFGDKAGFGGRGARKGQDFRAAPRAASERGFGKRSEGGEQRGFGKRSEAGEQRGFGKRSEGGQRSFGKRSEGGEQRGFGKRNEGGQRGFGKREGAQRGFGKRTGEPRGAGKGFGDKRGGSFSGERPRAFAGKGGGFRAPRFDQNGGAGKGKRAHGKAADRGVAQAGASGRRRDKPREDSGDE